MQWFNEWGSIRLQVCFQTWRYAFEWNIHSCHIYTIWYGNLIGNKVVMRASVTVYSLSLSHTHTHTYTHSCRYTSFPPPYQSLPHLYFLLRLTPICWSLDKRRFLHPLGLPQSTSGLGMMPVGHHFEAICMWDLIQLGHLLSNAGWHLYQC